MYRQVDAVDALGVTKRIEVEGRPDSCPHCHRAGKQIEQQVAGMLANEDKFGHRERLFVLYRCPVQACGRPYFAVHTQGQDPVRDRRFGLAGRTPWSPIKYTRPAAVVRVSKEFYPILDQAAIAEHHELDLIAGPGYRKALEYLVKDYAVFRQLGIVSADALADGEQAQNVKEQIAAICAQPLQQVIATIKDQRIREVARRATWLGNDQVHYVQKWATKDLGDLKSLIDLVVSFIKNEATYEQMLADMPEPGKQP